MQAPKTRGLTNRAQGASTRSGCQPTGQGDPAPHSPAQLRPGPQASGQRTGSESPRGGGASRPHPQEAARPLVYLVSVRDAAPSGWGCGGHRPRHALGASITAHGGGF